MYELALQEREQFLNDYTAYVRLLYAHSDKSKLRDYAQMRHIDVEHLKTFGMFYIHNQSELLLPQYTDKLVDFGVISSSLHQPIFWDRYIMPIFDRHKRVLNLVGYSAESDHRYIYGTAKYYNRLDMLYGLENLNTAYEMGYAILTEGITDAQRVKSLGYPNCFAMCGTHSSQFKVEQLNRCRYGVICIPDRDSAGLKALKGWAFDRKIHLYIKYKYKDADEMLRTQENIEAFRTRLDDCITCLKANHLPKFVQETTII